MMKQYKHLLKTLLTPFLFELCGIIPLVLVSLGLVSVSAGIGLRNILVGQYFFLFYILAGAFFAYSIYLYLKSKGSCNMSGLKQNLKLVSLILVILTLFEGVMLIVLQLVEKRVYGQPQTLIKDFLGVAVSWWVIFALFLLFLRVKEGDNGKS